MMVTVFFHIIYVLIVVNFIEIMSILILKMFYIGCLCIYKIMNTNIKLISVLADEGW